MRRIDRNRAELDIITLPGLPGLVVAMAVAALFAAPALGQIGASVEDLIESDVETAVEQQVEEDLATAVEDQVEAEVAASVEDQVEAEVAASVEAQVEAEVAASVEDQVEADVASSVEQQVEAEVQASVEDQIEGSVEQQVQSGIAASIEAEVEASVAQGIELAVEGSIDESVAVAVEADVADGLEAGAEASLETGIETSAAPAGAAGEEGEEGSSAAFAGDLDAAGRTIERGVWIVLVPMEYSDRIDTWGFDVRERTELNGMDRVLLRIAAPGDRDIAQAALELALDAPGTVVDFNHVYGATQEGTVIAAPAAAVQGGKPHGRQEFGSPAAIGLIDSEIESAHPALAGAEIEQRDFVSFSNERPSVHGTAVASLMLAASREAQVRPGIARIRAASVFFRGDDGGIRATTAGLIAGLDWLMEAPDVDVINMSLAGPPNRLLEIAIGATAAAGHIVVAAVGNNGPTGEPLYPAAYEAVVGVTAVDAAHRIYRYAGRGRHVMFAAHGVDVEVAATAGRYGRLSGTSMAAPRVAIALAEAIAGGHSPDAALEALKAAAVDLGDPDFDEIFGFGLVAARPGEHPARHTGLRSPR